MPGIEGFHDLKTRRAGSRFFVNLHLEIDGALCTPPVECGLLPGVARAELLARGVLRERRRRNMIAPKLVESGELNFALLKEN